VLRNLICGVAVSAGCLLTVSSCGLPFVPVDYRTDLVLQVCRSTAPVVASLSACEALTSNVAAVRSRVVATLEGRSDAAQAQSAITIRSDGDIDVRTTLTTAAAVSVFTKTGSVAFATAVAGAPDPGSATFLVDQHGRFDAQQFSDQLVYPTGYHWKIDTALPGGDIASATVGTDGTTGQVAVDINFNSAGAAEWTRITNAAFAAYTDQSADPSGMSQIAIFLDSDVLTAPEVTGGGQSSQTEITGNFTVESATNLADYISGGALPAPVAIVSINGEPPTPTS
jgi:preprotein translocase subunit SecD